METKTIEYKSNKGTLSIKSSGIAPKIGDVVTLKGKQAPEGEYFPEAGFDGSSIKVDSRGIIIFIGESIFGSLGTGKQKKGGLSIGDLAKKRKATYKK